MPHWQPGCVASPQAPPRLTVASALWGRHSGPGKGIARRPGLPLLPDEERGPPDIPAALWAEGLPSRRLGEAGCGVEAVLAPAGCTLVLGVPWVGLGSPGWEAAAESERPSPSSAIAWTAPTRSRPQSEGPCLHFVSRLNPRLEARESQPNSLSEGRATPTHLPLCPDAQGGGPPSSWAC